MGASSFDAVRLRKIHRNLVAPLWAVGVMAGLVSGAVSGGAEEAKKEDQAETASYGDTIVMAVDKSRLRAHLMTWPSEVDDSRILRSFQVAIGKGVGDKQREGDEKTPEGIYFAQEHIPGSRLPARYGEKAIPINFPNPMDNDAGKTGYGIWLHGVKDDKRIEKAKVTKGCVAFYNPAIDKLSSWLVSHQGVVMIAKDASKLNHPEDVRAVRKATEGWMEAWAGRKLDDYIGYYDQGFHHANGSTKEKFKAYKKRVFDSYDEMVVEYSDLRVLVHPKYAVSFFNQDFHGDDRYHSVGRKILYWQKDDKGRWRVQREVFQNRRFRDVKYSEAELALLTKSGRALSSRKEKENPNL